MKIVIIVEGRTEAAFKPFLIHFLENYLKGKMPRLVFSPYDGRIPKEEKLRRVVENHFKGKQPADAVIALTDVYTGTSDFTDASHAKNEMRKWVGKNEKFYPHTANHDFEAWLLPYWDSIQRLAGHNKKSPGKAPESVNHNTPPAKHIQEIFELGKCRDSYSKPRDAPKILKEKDLLVSANACPELKAFLNTIIGLSGGELIA